MHFFIWIRLFFWLWRLVSSKTCSICSYTCYYVVIFHGSHDWSLDVCILILLISFKLDLKLVYTSKKRNEWTICHLFSGRRHSHNRRVEKASFFEPHPNQNTIIFYNTKWRFIVYFVSLVIYWRLTFSYFM